MRRLVCISYSKSLRLLCCCVCWSRSVIVSCHQHQPAVCSNNNTVRWVHLALARSRLIHLFPPPPPPPLFIFVINDPSINPPSTKPLRHVFLVLKNLQWKKEENRGKYSPGTLTAARSSIIYE